MLKFTQFTGSRGVFPKGTLTFEEVIATMTDADSELGSQHRLKIDQIREAQESGDIGRAKALKAVLPTFTPAGEFTYRNNASLIKDSYTSLCAIDIDVDGNDGVQWDELFTTISGHPSVIFCGRSPRGEGIKALAKVKRNAYKPEDQYRVFRDVVYSYFSRLWECTLDNAQGKLSQPFFMTFDADAYVNTDAIELELDYTYVSAESVMNGDVGVLKDIKPLVASIINRRLDKWNHFGKIAMFAGGCYAGGVFRANEQNIINALKDAASKNQWVEDIEVAHRQIETSFENGKNLPIDKDLLKAKSHIPAILYKLEQLTLPDNPYILVGNDYYKKGFIVNAKGMQEPSLFYRKRQTIIDLLGNFFLQSIPTFDAFCNVPDYINHQYQVGNCFNLWQPFVHEPEDGDFPTIRHLFEHIFLEQVEEAFDYIQLLYTKPRQILPVLCLVSATQQTGKTTFIEFLSWLFKGNVAIVSTNDIEADFNQHYVSKHIIAVDESDLHKENTTSKIKQMATQERAFRKAKYQQESDIEFHGKFILLSNNERSFINIKQEDIRYWVRKVPPINSFDPDYKKKLEAEIPAFVFFFQNRQMKYSESRSRSWFPDEAMNTKWRADAIKSNRSTLWHELVPALVNWFGTNESVDEIKVIPKLLNKQFLDKDRQYSNKYIGKTLREEMGLKSFGKNVRFDNPFYVTYSDEGYNIESLVGDYYTVTRADIQEIGGEFEQEPGNGVQVDENGWPVINDNVEEELNF